MSIAPVQGVAVSNGSSTTQTVSTPGNVTIGNVLVVCFRYGSSTATIVSFVDGLGNTYTQRLIQVATITTAVYTSVITVGGACTITATLSVAATGFFALEEYSGANTGTPLDGTPVIATGTSTTPASGNLTTTVNGSALMGHLAQGAAAETPPGGWVVRQAAGNSVSLTDLLGAVAGTYNYQPTLASSVVWHCGILGLRTAVASAGGSAATMLLLGVGG